jgi:hypothetical protein
MKNRVPSSSPASVTWLPISYGAPTSTAMQAVSQSGRYIAFIRKRSSGFAMDSGTEISFRNLTELWKGFMQLCG